MKIQSEIRCSKLEVMYGTVRCSKSAVKCNKVQYKSAVQCAVKCSKVAMHKVKVTLSAVKCSKSAVWCS